MHTFSFELFDSTKTEFYYSTKIVLRTVVRMYAVLSLISPWLGSVVSVWWTKTKGPVPFFVDCISVFGQE
uniref:Uncharacterized protein n=1 Tax=Anguilla anguilla TaxID=7936 RepID=A0A0E9T9Q2_ANGAN